MLWRMTSPVSIEVSGVSKSFRVPTQGARTLRERATHPILSRKHREFEVLKEISFEIHRGEFFGIVGRNGSGKSTLLKLVSSIYKADAGTIRVAGRLAPFIELGVGFNAELSAWDNVVLNGVMMGLTPEKSRQRFDEIIAFAELEDFTELKLRNYSSGMRVRLAFAVMAQVEADVLLVDEVLAVGDAAFQTKCQEEFARMQAEGRTVVLVTHSMGAVRRLCDRALLLEDGKVAAIGDPDEVATGYEEVNEHRRGRREPRARQRQRRAAIAAAAEAGAGRGAVEL